MDTPIVILDTLVASILATNVYSSIKENGTVDVFVTIKLKIIFILD